MSHFSRSTFRMEEGIDYSHPAVRWDGIIYALVFRDWTEDAPVSSTTCFYMFRSVADARRHMVEDFTRYVAECELAAEDGIKEKIRMNGDIAECQCGGTRYTAEIVPKSLC